MAEDTFLGEWQTHEDNDNLVVTQAESLMAQMSIGAANSAKIVLIICRYCDE